MAEVKKKQEEGFGSGLLSGLKQIGSDLMDFLQTPEAMQFGRGILNSKSPSIMGFIGDGYDAYQDAKKKNAEAAMKQQVQQMDAALKMAKVQEIQNKIGARNAHNSALNARRMGMGGGTPSSGRGMPTLADYQNANLRFREEPSGSTQKSEGNELTPPRGMSIDAQIAAGYPVSQEQALTEDDKALQASFMDPNAPPPTEEQIRRAQQQQQFGQGQHQASFAPQAQGSDEQFIREMAAQGYFNEDKFGEGWKTLLPEKESWTLEKSIDQNTGKGSFVRFNPKTGQMIPLQGGFSPYEKPEADVRINKIREKETDHYIGEVEKFRSAAAASTDMLSKSGEVIQQFLANPDLRSGPGVDLLEMLKRGTLAMLGAPGDKNRGLQESLLKSIGQFMGVGGKQLQSALGSKNGLTNQETVDIVPKTIMTQENSREGIFEIANMIKVVDGPIQEGYRAAQELYNEWKAAIEAGVDPGFDLNMELHMIGQIVAKKKEAAIEDYLKQREEFQNSRKKSK